MATKKQVAPKRSHHKKKAAEPTSAKAKQPTAPAKGRGRIRVHKDGQLGLDVVHLRNDNLLRLVERLRDSQGELQETGYSAILKTIKEQRDEVLSHLPIEGDGRYEFVINDTARIQISRHTSEDHEVSGRVGTRIKVEDVTA